MGALLPTKQKMPRAAAAVKVLAWLAVVALLVPSSVDAQCALTTECPLGKYCLTSVSACASCSAGWYRSSLSQTSCTQCAAGTYSPGATVGCEDCGEGYYSNLPAKTVCKACEEGYYRADKPATDCLECNDGKYQDQTGQSTCKDCDAGAGLRDWFAAAGTATWRHRIWRRCRWWF